MIKEYPSFQHCWWLPNGHMQTLFAAFTSRPIQQTRCEYIDLPENDQLELHWLTTMMPPDAPILVLLHGLEGSVYSPYIQGMLKISQQKGWRAAVLHYRGSNGRVNKTPKSYHAGKTDDLISVLKYIESSYPQSNWLAAVGYSMGGNLLLKFLGEHPSQNWIDTAVAVSVPFDLEATSRYMGQGIQKIYDRRFVKSLKESITKKIKLDMPMPVNEQELQRIHNLYDFDDRITAPLHGFKDAKDYYTRCSSQYFLNDIQTPTLIIHAEDDPMIPKQVIPAKQQRSNPHIIWEIQTHGGHVGFISGGRPGKLNYWLEERIPAYLSLF